MNEAEPVISILVVIYRMSRQAENTLRSLSVPYQRGIDPAEYEVIVVENHSNDELGCERAQAIAPNIHYFHRTEQGVSPVPALNFALARSQGEIVGIMIDGARMLTPGVLQYVMAAYRMHSDALVAVPGYHLGDQDQQAVTDPVACKREEARLLESVDWFHAGYSLFDIACLSEANPAGYLTHLYESNCLFCSRAALEEIGGFDERFDMEGGGGVNLVLYARLASRPSTRLFMLAGEGSFHQYHHGVTTRAEGREERVATQREQLERMLGGTLKGVNREPSLLGAVPEPAQRFLERSAYYNHFVHKLACEKGWVRFPLDTDSRP